MRNQITLFDIVTQGGVSGYTVRIYAYDDSDPNKYSGSILYTMTDNGDGTYHADITTTIKATITVESPSGTITVPEQFKGYLFQGDNQLTIDPTTLP